MLFNGFMSRGLFLVCQLWAIVVLAPSAWAQRIEVDDLSIASQIPTISIDARKFRGIKTAQGKFYSYSPFPSPNQDWGLLVPKRDQSTNRDLVAFAPAVIEGTIASDVAATLYDKIDQLRRQEHFRGPKVKYLALVRSDDLADASVEIGLVVEHLSGHRVQPFPNLRTPKEERDYLGLFLEMGENESGFYPLDYHNENVLEEERPTWQGGLVLRPVDVLLTSIREILPIKKSNPSLYNLRMHQVGYTVISVEQALAHGDLKKMNLGRVKRCRDLLHRMKSELPEFEITRAFITEQLSKRQSPVKPNVKHLTNVKPPANETSRQLVH